MEAEKYFGKISMIKYISKKGHLSSKNKYNKVKY
jgi:hypothetical protein